MRESQDDQRWKKQARNGIAKPAGVLTNSIATPATLHSRGIKRSGVSAR